MNKSHLESAQTYVNTIGIGLIAYFASHLVIRAIFINPPGGTPPPPLIGILGSIGYLAVIEMRKQR